MPSVTARSRRAVTVVTIKPAMKSRNVMVRKRKKTELPKPLTIMNNNRAIIKTTPDRAWFIIDSEPVLVARNNSTNKSPILETRNRSPQDTVH